MKCESIQNWLMQAEDLQVESWPAEKTAHVETCASCAKLVRDLRRVEEEWRQLPVPESQQARVAFLQQLPTLNVPPKAQRSRWRQTRWAAAAIVLISTGIIGWMVLPGESRASSSDLVDRLIDWNLALTNATDPADRARLLAEREANFREALRKDNLTAEDRELAEKLLENGRWMASNEDPLAEAARFDELAELFGEAPEEPVAPAPTVAKKSASAGYNATARCAALKIGYFNSINRAACSKNLDGDKKKHFEQFVERDQRQAPKFEKFIEHAPERFRPDLRKAFVDAHKSRKPFFPFKK